MDRARSFSKLMWLPTLMIVMLGLLAQACNTINIEKGAISVDCKKDGMGPGQPDDCVPPECETGCAPGGNAAGQSAQGFFGIGGANPVPAGNTCSSGILCANPGMGGCNVRLPGNKCTNAFTYATKACSCMCK